MVLHFAHAWGGVLLVADGVFKATLHGSHVGWGGVVPDDQGILATVHSGMGSEVRCAAEDCTLAMLRFNGGTPSDCPWVDCIPLALAEVLGYLRLDIYMSRAVHGTNMLVTYLDSKAWQYQWQSGLIYPWLIWKPRKKHEKRHMKK